MDIATKEMQMQLALDDLRSQSNPIYGATADKYEGVNCATRSAGDSKVPKSLEGLQMQNINSALQ